MYIFVNVQKMIYLRSNYCAHLTTTKQKYNLKVFLERHREVHGKAIGVYGAHGTNGIHASIADGVESDETMMFHLSSSLTFLVENFSRFFFSRVTD